MSDFTDQLQQASFRGVPFGVLISESRFGRRIALHEYPNRDKPWAEDLGRSTRPFVIQGFLITDSAVYGGGDVLKQRDAMVAAVETLGPGPLVHPTLGELSVSIQNNGLTVVERWDRGRYFEISIACIESGDREFPGDQSQTQDATDAAADDADDAGEEDFADSAVPAYQDGASIVDMALRTATSFTQNVLMYAVDATSLFNSLVELPGNFGRYAAGALVGFATRSPAPESTATIGSLISAGTAALGAVEVACAVLMDACSRTDPAAIAAAGQGVTASLLASTANPADGIRVLTLLCNFFPHVTTSPSISGMAESSIQTALGALLRRCSFASLARASALYQPSSADDAANLRQRMGDLFQSEIDIAGDQPDDNSFVAIRALRAAIILDLDTRGGGLPTLQTVKSGQPMPACVLAQRLYQDAGRTDELITEANPAHPAFMPTSFKALGA